MYREENYIIRDISPDCWRPHINAKVIARYIHLMGGHIADIGCNHGACTWLMSEYANIERVTGIDVNCDAVRVATENNKNDKIEYRCENVVESLTGQFDHAFSFHTLEHILQADIQPFLRNIRRAVSGLLVVSIPYERWHNDPHPTEHYNEHTLPPLFDGHFKCIECYADEEGCLTGLFE
jgi:2-polyprenyl-3-methyl-5-hydroxy-6-metoxy-1,4-benzoquinol methylase